MTANVARNFSLFDALILKDRSFSVYRLPECKVVTLVMQQEGVPEYLRSLTELNGKEGFVIAPFHLSIKTPLVLLHPDLMIEGESRILDFLQNVDLEPEVEQSFSNREDIRTDAFSIYKNAFELFKSALRSKACEKIVLSRTLDRPKPIGFSAGMTFKAACEAYPEAFVYLCHTLKTGTWLGSSPELILSGEGTNWQTVALAGTMKLSSKDEDVEWNEKNMEEQQIVTEYLGKQLKTQHLTFTKNGPFTSRAGQLMHLKTEFNFQMNESTEIGQLLEILHPTPAVCGYPKKDTYKLILENEGYDRMYYSGFMGQLSLNGKTDLFVNLRCMQIKPEKLTFFAGGGLLSYSELEAEWKETEEKLQTMLSLIDF